MTSDSTLIPWLICELEKWENVLTNMLTNKINKPHNLTFLSVSILPSILLILHICRSEILIAAHEEETSQIK